MPNFSQDNVPVQKLDKFANFLELRLLVSIHVVDKLPKLTESEGEIFICLSELRRNRLLVLIQFTFTRVRFRNFCADRSCSLFNV